MERCNGMTIKVFENYDAMSDAAAELIAEVVKSKPNAVLGLATGATPEGTYSRLGDKCAAGDLDFSEVRTVNLDEYYPISPEDDQSYRYFMNKNLFSRTNIKLENTHLPNGAAADPIEACSTYEKLVASLGYADVQVLGVGQNGHIGFNEPGDVLYPETHLTPLTESTMKANSIYFTDRAMPTEALTMGMGSIMRAKSILLLISGKSKHPALTRLLAGEITTECPVTFVLLHSNVTVLCDKAAYEG